MRSALVQGKRMALLSFLAVARPRGFHRRDTLCGLFWPEVDQSHARAALRQALHFLRQSLGRDIVANRGPEEVGLDFASITCDAIQFEEALERGDAEGAVGLYGGPLLHGFYLSDAPEFEKWLTVERERLAQKYEDALRSLAAAATERGDHAGAARWWKRLAVHDPYSPAIACEVMAALDAAGERAAAIEHARVHAEMVRADLEMEPDSGVQEFAARLRAEPSHRAVPPLAEPRVLEHPEAAQPLRAPHATRPRPRATRGALWYALGAPVILLILIGIYAIVPKDTDTAAASRLSVGVLPFENLGPPDDEYFVTGLTEDVVSRLAGVRILSIVGPSDLGFATSNYLGEGDEAALGAEYLLRATVERVHTAGGTRSIRVTPSLIRNADGVRLWTESIDEDPARLLELQARIAEEVPRALGIPLLSTEREWLRAQPTSDLQAYDQFLRANQYLRGDSSSAAEITRAVELFRSATTLDTGFVHAYAKLSVAHTLMFSWAYDRSPGRLVAAKAAADRAMYLRADAPISHLALAWYYSLGIHDYDRALRHFELARANWPGLSDVLVLVGDIRRRRGDLELALANYSEALSANPSCATCAAEAAVTHLMLRDFDSAEQEATRAIGIAPDLSYPRYVAAMTRISAGADIELVRQVLPRPRKVQGQELVDLATGPWGAITRIVGGEYDAMLGRLVLSAEVADTAGYYLAEAELAWRSGDLVTAGTYYHFARAELEPQVDSLPDDAQLRGRLGLAYAGVGMRDAAVTEGLEAARLMPLAEDVVDGAVASELLARIYVMLGDADSAINRLELLLSGPSLMSRELLRRDPMWAPLREHPRFQRLVH